MTARVTSAPTMRSRTGIRSARVAHGGVVLRHANLSTADVLVPAVFVLCVLIALTLTAIAPEAPAVTQWSTVRVKPAATLWDLARAHPIPGLSTAETVGLIRERNDLPTASLFVGQALEVPLLDSVSPVAAVR